VSYFQKNLTVINVNTSPADEIGPTLQVNQEVLDTLMARRRVRPFQSVADLVAVGVNQTVAEKLSGKQLIKY
jgi:hypothetical protein